jgi:hypothetical protein
VANLSAIAQANVAGAARKHDDHAFGFDGATNSTR